jgi:hypothetical protein
MICEVLLLAAFFLFLSLYLFGSDLFEKSFKLEMYKSSNESMEFGQG